MAENKFYEIRFSSPEYKTVGGYCNAFGSPVFGYAGKESEFLSIKDENNVSNRDRVLNTYTDAQKEKYQDKASKDLILKIGTRLLVPIEKVERNTLLTQGLEVVSNDVVAFKAKALAELEKDPGYTQIYKTGQAKEMYPDMTVWVWCRGLSAKTSLAEEDTDRYEMKGEIFDLTPFISRVSTTMNKNGGNFQLVLPPLVCSMTEEGKWIIKKDSLKMYANPKNLSLSDQGYVAEGSLYDENGIRNQFLFQNIISSNDMIWIRYETLDLEKEDRFTDAKNLYVDKKNLPGKIYDMIGLVDNDGISMIPSSNDVAISVSGRDLSKLFIEDGTHFFPLEFSQKGQLSFSGSATQKSSLLQRVFSDNMLMYFNLWYSNSIENVFKFVIQQLSTIKVVPDSLFAAYGDRRNTRLEEGDRFKGKGITEQLTAYENKARKAIKQLRLQEEISVEENSLVEDSKVTDVFVGVKMFLQEIRNQNVRDISNYETSGWRSFQWQNPAGVLETVDDDNLPSWLNNRLIKFSNHGDNATDAVGTIIQNIDLYLDVQNSQGKFKKPLEKKVGNGIWQIIKLVIDKAVTDRRIVDSAASSASGSLMNFFRQVCQEPFVEYYMDTYGDTYNLIVRKPPTDQVGLISLLEGKVNTEDGTVISGAPAVIDIQELDVLKEELSMGDRDVYSWYHLSPKYNFLGNDDAYSYVYLPALFFEEYAEVWGSKPMDLCHNYMPFLPLDAKNDNVLDSSEKQAINDLKYLVESNQMNPFLRSGTITVNGDRRLKVGNIVRYKPSGEIFMIDMVQQNYVINEQAIDRTTTIHVSRGMIEQLIYGVPVTGENINQEQSHISYFNIIDTRLNLNYTDSSRVETYQVKTGERTIKGASRATTGLDNAILQAGNEGLYHLNKYDNQQRDKFITLINKINEAGYKVIITSGVRSFAEQAVCYRKNKKNAKPGNSKHNTGDAIDINLIATNGTSYRKSTVRESWISTGVPELAKSLGFKWGGEVFKSYYDPVHFEITKDSSSDTGTTEPIYETRTRTVKGKYLDRSSIFTNFKVNKHVFNFFMRNEQFNKIWLSQNVSRMVYKPDVQEALGEGIVVSAKRKR